MSVLNQLCARLRLLLPTGKQPWLVNFASLNGPVKSILCLPASGLGDVVMDAPAIHALKQRFPSAKVSVLVQRSRGTDEICRLMPAVDETIDLDLKSYRWNHVIQFMLYGFWKLLFRLRKSRFDLAVVFWPNPVRRLLLAGVGSKYWIYSNLIDEYPGLQNLKLLKLAGIEKTDRKGIFDVPEPPDKDRILPSILRKPLIGVHPFCGMTWREWKGFGLLQQELCSLNGTVVVVGRKAGYQPYPAVHNLVNKLTVVELFWVIKQCDVFVTADSGPMHISIALNTPTVALFGPVKPELRLSPQDMSRHAVIYRPSPQSQQTVHATQRKRLNNEAMQEITVDEVIEAVRNKLLIP
jgi:ADP-heptose:LPS heptosyltransferase